MYFYARYTAGHSHRHVRTRIDRGPATAGLPPRACRWIATPVVSRQINLPCKLYYVYLRACREAGRERTIGRDRWITEQWPGSLGSGLPEVACIWILSQECIMNTCIFIICCNPPPPPPPRWTQPHIRPQGGLEFSTRMWLQNDWLPFMIKLGWSSIPAI